MNTAELARQYIKRGWYVFPVHSVTDGQCTCGVKDCSDAGKHPRTARGLKDASIDSVQIEKWFGGVDGGADAPTPISNIGIRTGEVSGITVVDIDPGKGGTDTWTALIDGHGEPVTLVAATGGGGMHFVFLYNSALKTSSNTLGKGVDVRNDGGYIVAAPSKHKSGGVYAWIDSEVAICALPAFLAAVKAVGKGKAVKAVKAVTRKKYPFAEVKEMLEVIPSDDRSDWRNFGIILGREFKRHDDAWDAYVEWADKAGGKKGKGHDKIMHDAFYKTSREPAGEGGELTIGTIVSRAKEHGWAPCVSGESGGIPKEDFVYFAEGNSFTYRPTNRDWIAAAVDSAVAAVNVRGKLIKASDWIRGNRRATCKTCDPSIHDNFIRGVNYVDGKKVPDVGAATYNTYMPPVIKSGDAASAGPFTAHCRRVFNKDGDADQFMDYMAHRVQRPWEKPRFALLLGGEQGTGKDVAVEFCVPAIGLKYCNNIEPWELDAGFNEYAAGAVLRINETANIQEMNKWAFNNRTKVLIAGRPDWMNINPKYERKYAMNLFCGVIVTTNHMLTGIHIEENDRRYDVISCAGLAEMGIRDRVKRAEYFRGLWGWFNAGGDSHTAAFLRERDVSGFEPNTLQRETEAYRALRICSMKGEEWLQDVLDALGEPVAVRGDVLMDKAVENGETAADVKRKMTGAADRCGYVHFPNPNEKRGRWVFNKKQYSVYVKKGTPASWDVGRALKDGIDSGEGDGMKEEVF